MVFKFEVGENRRETKNEQTGKIFGREINKILVY